MNIWNLFLINVWAALISFAVVVTAFGYPSTGVMLGMFAASVIVLSYPRRSYRRARR